MKKSAEVQVACRESETVRLTDEDVDEIRELMLTIIARRHRAQSATPANDSDRAAA